MVDLQEIEAIKRLKYRYVRCLDQKRWKELEECFTEDATASYSDGKYSFAGRGRIMQFLTGAMSPNSMITSHTVHHPEIDFTSETAARGVWALTDTVIETSANITIRGAAFYEDEYVKVDGQWKIKSTGYKRIFEEVVSRGDTPSLKLTASCWKKD
jgi:bile-acid 7alpha-dehydratase